MSMERLDDLADAPPLSRWAVLELLGYRKLAGRLYEFELAGQVMLGIDVPQDDGSFRASVFPPERLYALTEVSEAEARELVQAWKDGPPASWLAEARYVAYERSAFSDESWRRGLSDFVEFGDADQDELSESELATVFADVQPFMGA